MIVIIVVLKIIMYFFLTLLGLLLLLFLLPMSYGAEVLYSDTLNVKYYWGWPWKLIGIKGSYGENNIQMGVYFNNRRLKQFNIIRDKEEVKEEDKEEAKDAKKENPQKEKKIKKPKVNNGFGNYLNKNLIGIGINYFKSIISIIKPDYFYLKGNYGFEDPSITGMICGGVSVIQSAIPNFNIQMYPDFINEGYDLDFKINGKITVGSIVFQTIKTILKKDVRRIIFNKSN